MMMWERKTVSQGTKLRKNKSSLLPLGLGMQTVSLFSGKTMGRTRASHWAETVQGPCHPNTSLCTSVWVHGSGHSCTQQQKSPSILPVSTWFGPKWPRRSRYYYPVFHCWVVNHHESSGLKQYSFITPLSLDQFSRVSCLVSLQAEMKVWWLLHSIPVAQLRKKICLQVDCQNSFPCCYMTEALALAVSVSGF